MSSPRAPVNKQLSIVPDLPRDPKMLDKDGNCVAAWMLYFQQLNQALQIILSPEGFAMPQQSADNIALLGDTFGSVGNIIYDSTNNVFKGIELVSLGPPIVTITKTFTLT